MYTAPFSYLRPADLGEAEAMFSRSEDARFLAGGMTLIPTMKQRLATPELLIDLAGIPDLAFIRQEADRLTIGAMSRHIDVAASDIVRGAIPALASLAGSIGDLAVRHRGTIGGSLANNDPSADYPAAALGLGATIRTTRREIAADDFFLGMFSTALEPAEIVIEVSFPIPQAAGYAKVRNHASRYAMAGVFVARFHGGVRVAATGAGPCVFRASQMEAALDEDFSQDGLLGVAVDPAGLNADIHGSAEYRANLVAVVAGRAVAATRRVDERAEDR